MGYLGNHLATVVTGVFAAVLTALWPFFVSFAPILDFVFLMAVPITWFLVFTCWIAQKSADYMHANSHDGGTTAGHGEKKSLNLSTASDVASGAGGVVQQQQQQDDGDVSDIRRVQSALLADLDGLKASLKLKDSEIERLNRQIANLQTRVQIETLKAELANLKMLASKQKR